LSLPSSRKILRAKDGVREEPSDFPRHIAGRPMLTKEMLTNAGGAIVNLHDSIQYLEERLLQEKNPGYPVYTIKVPEGHGFVDTSPAEIFFVWYKDIYNLLHSNRSSYNNLFFNCAAQRHILLTHIHLPKVVTSNVL
jgi:hypothetical protein